MKPFRLPSGCCSAQRSCTERGNKRRTGVRESVRRSQRWRRPRTCTRRRCLENAAALPGRLAHVGANFPLPAGSTKERGAVLVKPAACAAGAAAGRRSRPPPITHPAPPPRPSLALSSPVHAHPHHVVVEQLGGGVRVVDLRSRAGHSLRDITVNRAGVCRASTSACGSPPPSKQHTPPLFLPPSLPPFPSRLDDLARRRAVVLGEPKHLCLRSSVAALVERRRAGGQAGRRAGKRRRMA